MFKVLIASVFVVFLLAPMSTRADGVDIVDEYNVQALLTITGNNTCPLLPACAETLDFSFKIGSAYSTTNNFYYLTLVPDSASVLSLGPLEAFTAPESGGPTLSGFPGCSVDCNYLELHNPQGDEIDLLFYSTYGSTPITPQVTYTDLYGCGSATDTCATDFSVDGITGGQYLLGEVTATVTPTPEPSSLLFLGIGLFSLVVLALRRSPAFFHWRFMV